MKKGPPPPPSWDNLLTIDQMLYKEKGPKFTADSKGNVKKNYIKGGTIRFKSGGPVVDGYKY